MDAKTLDERNVSGNVQVSPDPSCAMVDVVEAVAKYEYVVAWTS